MPGSPLIDAISAVPFAMADRLRRMQGAALDLCGFGPRECAFDIIRSGPHWRLRRYGRADHALPVLMVPAPIKRPYLWDLKPSVSAVRYCLDHGFGVHLLEWMPPVADGHAGLDEYAGIAISACVTAISSASRRAALFLMGHSFGGTLAAIYCALEPQSVRGLVLLGSPLCFEQASSRFRDTLVSIVPAELSDEDIVAGSLLSQASAIASPDTFLWSRLMDVARSLPDPVAMDIHARIERWTLDEVALPGRLVKQLVQQLYRENQFCRGSLTILGKTVGPASMAVPMLAIVNADDEVGPAASIAPFISKMPTKDVQIIEYPGEVGVGLQHLAILAGREAYARVWPQIISWLEVHS